MMILSNNIITKRNALRITQTELANMIGVSPAHISRLESGVNNNPTAQILIALRRVLSISIDDLLLTEQPIDINTHISIDDRLKRIEQHLTAQGDFTIKEHNKQC